ncbi:Leucine-rich repeat (LRR) protein [Aquimarina amphilecti]|uniref:Leucine-rich repeat (LRR) protein n=1 Tax=Aquimarina amphilecti TaxID=1038014 RepID=A0A1H7VPA8_AQUAM|nr:leucine-rich repeat domain-containing protein [Aquimarina amphilecti]SEM10864.1 Leucine-rich repeat (LRR) protein [Aquimarina amphilecti]
MKNLYLRVFAICACLILSCTKEIEADLITTVIEDDFEDVNNVLLKILKDNPDNTLNWSDSLDNINNWEGLVIENDKLIGLDIENKGIKVLTPTINLLEDLIVLKLKNNELSNIPNELFDLKKLENLSLSGGTNLTIQIDDFLPGLFSLSNLKELDLDHFEINEIEGVGALNQLENLILEDIPLDVIPSDIGQLILLEEINFTNNNFFEIPEGFFRLTNLGSITLINNKNLTTIPEGFGVFTRLDSLTITGSEGIQKFVNSISEAVILKKLDLSNNNIGFLTSEDGIIPDEIGMLSQLTDLNLENNHISSISSRIGELVNLKTINLRNNVVTDIPKELGALTILDVLDLSGNLMLNEIPEEVCKLEDLGAIIISEGECGDLRVSSEYGFNTTEVGVSSLFFIDVVLDAVIDPVFVDGDGPFDLDFGEIGFEIHEVNIEDVLTREDTLDQVLVNQTATQQFINGTNNLSYELISPSVPNKDLPEGRTYRVRLFNTEFSNVKTYLPAYELTVLE